MKIVHSGFDTIAFAVKGAACPRVLDHLELSKAKAVKDQVDTLVNINDGQLKGLIAPLGMKGGYAYVLKIGGELGHVICLKKNLGRDNWNGYIKIRSLSLACRGWKEAVENALRDLLYLGFAPQEISISRVDYAIDFLNADINLNPAHFVAHSRVKKAAYKFEITAHSRGQKCESVTLGKMPGRQVTVYDKRGEAIQKRKYVWFEIWGIDPKDITQTVHRVEMRAGKDELLKWDIRTFDDFRSKISHVMSKAVHVVRYVQPMCNDLNISRWPLQPIWKHVQLHVQNQMLESGKHMNITRVQHVLRDQKTEEYNKQILGNMAGLSICMEIDPKHMKDHFIEYVEEQFAAIEADDEHSFWKARNRASDRLGFR